MHFLCLKLPFLLLAWALLTECQESVETSTEPQWAPTGRLNQFAGFATPRPSLLPPNAQMVYASVWAAWSSWSFCSGGQKIRVRACNTVRGFTCLGPNQETEDCSAAAEARKALRINTIGNDYDVLDPWQEDRLEALKQLYPDDSMDEKLSHLPVEERTKLREKSRFAPPTPITHELLKRPSNENDGAPGSTPERLFGARQFAVKSVAEQDKIGDIFSTLDLESAKDISSGTEVLSGFAENDFSHEEIPDVTEIVETEATTEMSTTRTTRASKKFDMQGPEFEGEEFKNDIFGSIEEVVKTTREIPTTTEEVTTESTTEFTTEYTTTSTTTTTTTTPPTTTSYRPPVRVTPKAPKEPTEEEMFFELVTPAFIKTTQAPSEVITFELPTPIPQQNFNPRPVERTYRPVKLHEGEVPPRPAKAVTTTTTTTRAPRPRRPQVELRAEEISPATLNALDWMVANMTRAAQNIETRNKAMTLLMEQRDSPKLSQINDVGKKLQKKKKKGGRRKPKSYLHLGEVPLKQSKEKFPKYRNRYVQRQRMFGIKTSSGGQLTPTENFDIAVNSKMPTDRSELIQEINDLQELMVKIGSGVTTSDYSPPPSYSIKHAHDERA